MAQKKRNKQHPKPTKNTKKPAHQKPSESIHFERISRKKRKEREKGKMQEMRRLGDG